MTTPDETITIPTRFKWGTITTLLLLVASMSYNFIEDQFERAQFERESMARDEAFERDSLKRDAAAKEVSARSDTRIREKIAEMDRAFRANIEAQDLRSREEFERRGAWMQQRNDFELVVIEYMAADKTHREHEQANMQRLTAAIERLSQRLEK